MSFSVITDTSANLPTEFLCLNNVGTIPFSYFVEGVEQTCEDTAEYNCAEYFNLIRRGKKITTSQITPRRYINYMEPILASGKDILYIGMSSGVSGAFGSANIAADFLRKKISG